MAADPPGQLVGARRALRVLMLADHFGYEAGVKHGVTTYFLSVIPALQLAGTRIRAWFLRGEHEAAAPLADDGIPLKFFNSRRWSLRPLVPLIRLLRSGEVDLVHVTDVRSIGFALIASRLTGVPVLLHLHDALIPPGPIRALARLLAPPQTAAICVSSALRPVAMSLYGLPGERVATVHNGLDLARFRAQARLSATERTAVFGVDGTRTIIGVVARLHPVKGHAALFAAMPRILERCPGTVLVLVGAGPARADLERQAAALGIADSVRFLGQRDDIPRLLAGMDLTVLPSESEGFSLAALESLAAGTPVVAHDVGGVGDVVTNGVTGLLVAPGNPATLAAAVCELLRDDRKRAAFAREGRRDVGRFELANHVSRLLDAYEACARLRSRPQLPTSR